MSQGLQLGLERAQGRPDWAFPALNQLRGLVKSRRTGIAGLPVGLVLQFLVKAALELCQSRSALIVRHLQGLPGRLGLPKAPLEVR